MRDGQDRRAISTGAQPIPERTLGGDIQCTRQIIDDQQGWNVSSTFGQWN